MRARSLIVALAVAAAGAASAETRSLRYTCERGVEIPVVYITGVDPAVAVLTVENAMVVLEAEESASGARYGWPSGGSHYVWWTQGDTAMLLWFDAETGEDVSLHMECVAQ